MQTRTLRGNLGQRPLRSAVQAVCALGGTRGRTVTSTIPSLRPAGSPSADLFRAGP
jgi:hypothetical protein